MQTHVAESCVFNVLASTGMAQHRPTMSTLAGSVYVVKGGSNTYAALNPASHRPTVARRPAPPAPTTIASYVWSMTA